MLKKIMYAAVLAAGMGTSQAAVMISPGGAAVLGTVSGTAVLSAVSWDGTSLTPVVIAPFGAYGYVVDAASDTVVLAMTDVGPVHFASAPVGPGTYYLATDGSPFSVGSVEYKSENFTLVPEPGTYALLAGLGLVGFAGYRRFRR